MLSGTLASHSQLPEAKRAKLHTEYLARHAEIIGPQQIRISNLIEAVGSPYDRSASAENLLRLGLVEPLSPQEHYPTASKGREPDVQEIHNVVARREKERERMVEAARKSPISSRGRSLTVAVATTPWGKRFAEACQISFDKAWLDLVASTKRPFGGPSGD